MRSASITWATLVAFLFVLLAPPFATNADAATNPPAFLRVCDGTLSASALPIGPYGIDVNNDGALTYMYIVQALANTILIMLGLCSIDGTFGLSQAMSGPTGMLSVAALDRLYVADCGNSRILVYSLLGAFLFAFGAFGTAPGQLQFPYGLAHSSSSTNLLGVDLIYVADTYNNRIQYFDAEGVFQGEWGSAGTGNGQFANPRGIAIDAIGNVYVSDTENDRVQKFSSTGAYIAQWGGSGSGDGQLSRPNGLECGPVDVSRASGSSQAVYVVDTGNNRVQIFGEDGTYLTQFGSAGSGDGQFSGPADVDIDNNGDVFVTDQLNGRVQVFGYTTSLEAKSWGGIKAMYRAPVPN